MSDMIWIMVKCARVNGVESKEKCETSSLSIFPHQLVFFVDEAFWSVLPEWGLFNSISSHCRVRSCIQIQIFVQDSHDKFQGRKQFSYSKELERGTHVMCSHFQQRASFSKVQIKSQNANTL
ncbi:predicted protein [Histoplasma capsulatum G186AR]|uniref:Uncharacterized protein n=1 Tax=Ajellomyces capsulatus (strain G186AR / H82 / ATCC MYA-2454 / RMSCC 2432) TaxID=447093 RepID=C0NKI7_AJECG|nr:uncharacterized protein HCBG_03667 [Histoplasma capsulatum G186AR]EEH08378.1 predicted protein [Histoplasma capsulatum G186AR]